MFIWIVVHCCVDKLQRDDEQQPGVDQLVDVLRLHNACVVDRTGFVMVALMAFRIGGFRWSIIIYLISYFFPPAGILPRILPESFRKILPRNLSANVYSAFKILPRNPPAKILPRRSANQKIVYFYGSFRILPQSPSAESFRKC